MRKFRHNSKNSLVFVFIKKSRARYPTVLMGRYMLAPDTQEMFLASVISVESRN